MPVGEFEISGKKVVTLRLKAVLTRQEFAERGGMSVGSLRRIEGLERTSVQVETLRALAKGAGHTPERFLELVDGMITSDDDGDKTPPSGTYPLHGRVSASGWIDSIPADEIRYERFAGPHVDGAFALEIMGNSMAPKYLPGDYVLFRLVEEIGELRPGDDVYVQCDGNEHEGKATFKTIKDVRDGVLFLVPRNPEFEPLTVKCGHASRVAKAIRWQRSNE
jgi:SOS-response transcriptional repressor LexA